MSARNYMVLCLGAALSFTAFAAHAEGSQIFAGYNGQPDYDYGYVGGVTAVNHDLKADGLLLESTFGFGEYSFSSPAANANVNVNMDRFDFMVGYQKYFSAMSGGRVAGYIGMDYQDHKLDRTDNTDPVRGNEFGIKAHVEMRLNLDEKTYLSTADEYSSAFDTYCVDGRFGYYFDRFSFGPEVGFRGNQAFDEQRIGLFIGDIRITDDLSMEIGGGYEHADRQLTSGGYVDASVGYAF